MWLPFYFLFELVRLIEGEFVFSFLRNFYFPSLQKKEILNLKRRSNLDSLIFLPLFYTSLVMVRREFNFTAKKTPKRLIAMIFSSDFTGFMVQWPDKFIMPNRHKHMKKSAQKTCKKNRTHK